MQINSINNTHFGLKIDSYMQRILDNSKNIVAKKGQTELNKWEKAANKMKSTLSDEYCIYAAKNDTYPKDYLDLYLISNLSKNLYCEYLIMFCDKFIGTEGLKDLTAKMLKIKKMNKLS